MNANEASRIIAEYMADAETSVAMAIGKSYSLPSYLSLDALVPVWEKLKVLPSFCISPREEIECSLMLFDSEGIMTFIEEEASTVQGVAAIATAKAIEEIENDL